MPDRGFPPRNPTLGVSVRSARRSSPPWQRAGCEPSLESLFGDEVLLAVLARNGVTVEQLRDLSISVGERIRRASATCD